MKITESQHSKCIFKNITYRSIIEIMVEQGNIMYLIMK